MPAKPAHWLIMKWAYLVFCLYLLIASIGEGAGWIGFGIFIFAFLAGAEFECDLHKRQGET